MLRFYFKSYFAITSKNGTGTVDDVFLFDFLQQFTMKLLCLPTTKHIFSFILVCPQDFNFAWPFWYDWVETGLNGQNSQAKLKSYGHPRIKLKTCFVSQET